MAANAQCEYAALQVQSKELVVLGMYPDMSLNCAGMTLFRMYQGSVSILGFTPSLGMYYTLTSPKLDATLTMRGMHTNIEGIHSASYSDHTQKLLKLMYPNLPCLDAGEEQEADALAERMAYEFPIVIIFRTFKATLGNAFCYYVDKAIKALPNTSASPILPGFKLLLEPFQYEKLNIKEQSVLSSIFSQDAFQPLQITSEWEATANTISDSLDTHEKILICGAKGVGKSTFARFLVNKLLRRYPVIAYLDTDLGQPELTPPGVLSLHGLARPLLGPGYAQCQQPFRSYFCGQHNPGEGPVYYLKAISSLLQAYETTWSSIPLIINTHGWIKGMGYDLLCNILQLARPKHVVQQLAITKTRQFEVPESDWIVYTLSPWEGMYSNQVQRNARELRLLRFHSYFLSESSYTLMTERAQLDQQFYEAYEQLVPYVVRFSDLSVGFTNAAIVECELYGALNATLVGLCRLPKGLCKPGLLNPDLAHAPCLGTGFVRAVDEKKGLLFIISPLSHAVISKVNYIVRGNLMLEIMNEDWNHQPHIPYCVSYCLTGEGTGSGIMKSRKNMKRKRDVR